MYQATIFYLKSASLIRACQLYTNIQILHLHANLVNTIPMLSITKYCEPNTYMQLMQEFIS